MQAVGRKTKSRHSSGAVNLPVERRWTLHVNCKLLHASNLTRLYHHRFSFEHLPLRGPTPLRAVTFCSLGSSPSTLIPR